MDSTRQLKYARLIQKEMSDIFQREGYNYFGKAFVTVTGVRVSPDLGIAKIYVSIFGVKDSKAVLDQIDHHNKEIRHQLGNRIRHQARIIPELAFFLDEVEENALRMDNLIKNLNIPPADKEG